MQHYEIAVIGGGPAGVAAAVAAARLGRKVLIVERGNALGGAMHHMEVLPFMPYHTPTRGTDDPVYLVRGIFSEIVDRLIAMAKEIDPAEASWAKKPMGRFNDEYMKKVLSDLVHEAGVDVLYHAECVSAERTGNRVTGVTVSTIGGLLTVDADRYIDCTGDAQVAFLAGYQTRLGRESDRLCQPMTLCFRCGDVDVPTFVGNNKLIQTLYREARARGELKNPREDILYFHTASPTVIHFNTTRVVKKNPTDPFEVSLAEDEAREQVFELFRFLKKNAPGFEHATLLSTAGHIGVRESRMIVGEYTLTAEDLLALTKFDDGIAACNYDIDIHNPEGTGTQHHYFEDYTYYTIPYRCLIPKGADNLLVAGRCISVSHEAQASCRVIPFTAALGEAAGVAASISEERGLSVRKIPVDALLSQLRKEGAFIEKELDRP